MSFGGSDSGIASSIERDSTNKDGTNIVEGKHGHEVHFFESRLTLSRDLRFLSGMPEFCDVVFVVGEERVQMFAVKAILAIRSRVFYKLLQNHKKSQISMKSAKRLVSPANGKSFINNSLSNLFLQDTNFGSNVPIHSPSSKTTIEIKDFEPEVFKQLLEFIHTGSVVLKTRTLLGLINAAEHFGIEELRRACAEFSQKCIRVSTVCSLLVTAERYIQYKSTKTFVQKVLDFVDDHADEILELNDFVHLPLHVVELILMRCDTHANSLCKYRAVDRWTRQYTLEHAEKTYREVMIGHFVKYISFHLLPTPVLMREIRHLNIISEEQLVNSLAYQADPGSLSPVALKKIFRQKKLSSFNIHQFFSSYSDSSDSGYQEVGEDRLAVINVYGNNEVIYKEQEDSAKGCTQLNNDTYLPIAEKIKL